MNIPPPTYKEIGTHLTNEDAPKYELHNTNSILKIYCDTEQNKRNEEGKKIEARQIIFIKKYKKNIMKNIDKAYNNCNKRASEGKDNTLIYRINVRVCYKDDFKWLDSYIYRLNGRNKYPINIEHSHRYVRHDDTRYIHAIYFRW